MRSARLQRALRSTHSARHKLPSVVTYEKRLKRRLVSDRIQSFLKVLSWQTKQRRTYFASRVTPPRRDTASGLTSISAETATFIARSRGYRAGHATSASAISDRRSWAGFTCCASIASASGALIPWRRGGRDCWRRWRSDADKRRRMAAGAGCGGGYPAPAKRYPVCGRRERRGGGGGARGHDARAALRPLVAEIVPEEGEGEHATDESP